MQSKYTQRLTDSGIVTTEPCYLSSVVFSSTSGGVATASLCNGPDDISPVLVDLVCPVSDMRSLEFAEPLLFSGGIFFVATANVNGITVTFELQNP